MHPLWWTILGVVIGVVGLLPIIRLLLRRAERRAREADRRARASERLAELGSMTSGLAHEIKNPLSTIGLNAQLLSEGIKDADMSDENRERLQRRLGSLSREVERLSGILNDFLQFAGRIKLHPEPTDLCQLVQDVGDFFHPQTQQARVLLRVDVPPRPIMADVDQSLLKQALLNLMINATQAMSETNKDNQDGGARGDLIVRVESDDNNARIHVVDTGPGIQPEKMQDIFHPYVSTKSGGTGLGLPTAKRIIEEHGGHVQAHSEPGRGSDFVIHLPLQPTSSSDHPTSE